MKPPVSSSFSAGDYSLSWLLDKLWQKLNPTNEDTPVVNEPKAENSPTQGLSQSIAHPPQFGAIKEERSVSPVIKTENPEVGDVKAEPTSNVDINTQDGTPHLRAPDSYEGFNVWQFHPSYTGLPFPGRPPRDPSRPFLSNRYGPGESFDEWENGRQSRQTQR